MGWWIYFLGPLADLLTLKHKLHGGELMIMAAVVEGPVGGILLWFMIGPEPNPPAPVEASNSLSPEPHHDEPSP